MKRIHTLKPNRPLALLSYATLGLLGSLALSANEIKEVPLHIEQSELNAMTEANKHLEAFQLAFDVGDELFEHPFLAEEGIGANVGNGHHFTLVPRADLSQDKQWANHIPKRVTGPNAQSCTVCHGQPFGDGAGPVVMNNIRDPLHSGDISQFINRQTPHLFGIGALQRLAEEMSEDLERIRHSAIITARNSGQPITRTLRSKGIHYGSITVHPDGTVDNSQIVGIDDDLLVKPIEWKGLTSNIRAFVRDAAHNELGMQATEITGDNIDGDGDGVVNELSVGDITALVIYQAAQPRPTSKKELSWLGIIPPLSLEERRQINLGEKLFEDVGCGSCHQSQLTLKDPIYTEPSQNPKFRDTHFPAGQDPKAYGLSPLNPIRFDLTQDLPDNIVEHANGQTTHLGNFEKAPNGGAIVRLYGDLKRHDMGTALAEAIDEGGKGRSTFLTKELWGVGSTAPYLHDGRATTLEEAIQLHGGDSADSREKFNAMNEENRQAIIAFLDNLVLYKNEEE